MDYTTLTGSKSTSGSIKNWVGSDKIPADEVLNDAERYIFTRLRVREMLSWETATLSSGISQHTLPGRPITPRRLYITGTEKQEIQHKTPEFVLETRAYDGDGNLTTGKPRYYFMSANDLIFDIKTDKSYTVEMLFYEFPEALSGSNTTNLLTDRYPRILRAATAAFAHEWLQDTRQSQSWLQKCEMEIQRVNMLSDEAEYMDAHLQMDIGA